MSVLKSFYEIGLTPVIGAELEFYLDQPKMIDLINNKCKKISSLFYQIENEKGLNQFEVKTRPSKNISLVKEEIHSIKKTIINTAIEEEANVDFSAKPFLDRPGNALQIHINLIDQKMSNIFTNKRHLLPAIAGLCSCMKASMLAFAPTPICYYRYQYPDENTPTTVSWGYNNRSAALRVIPGRIEHRVPCSDCDVEKTINEILKATLYGVTRTNFIPPTYGMAFKGMYTGETLPMTFTESKRYYILQNN